MKKYILTFIFIIIAVCARCGDFSLAVLDVGQGLCVTVQSPNGQTLVYDCGTSDWNDTDFDKNSLSFDNVLQPYLKKTGAKKIDYMVLSHPHTDHYTGLLKALDIYSISKFIYNGRYYRNKNYSDLLSLIQAKKISYTVACENYKFNMGEDTHCVCLAPLDNFEFEDPDNNSIVLKITYKNINFLLTGDLGQEAEPYLIQKQKNALKSQVLVCGGHGTKYSSTDNFLSAVNPKYAVISCGKDNPYHLPHAPLLKRLEKHGAEILRTDTKGNIIFTVSEKGILTVK